MNAQAIAIEFADRLNRERTLTDDETDLVCKVVASRQQRVYRLWTAKDDRTMIKLFRKHNAVEVARIMERTPGAVRFRKSLLKARAVVGGAE